MTVASGGAVKALNAKGLADLTQGELKSLEEIAKSLGAKGLAFIKVEGGEWKSPIVKFFSEAEKAALAATLEVADGDMIFFAAAPWEKACAILGRIRLEAAALLQKRGKLTLQARRLEVPLGGRLPADDLRRGAEDYVATHHPFTAPVPEDIGLIDTEPEGGARAALRYRAKRHGARRRVDPHPPARPPEEDLRGGAEDTADVVESRFGYMLRAFTYGAPPHGGIAFGLDRIAALLCGTNSIRDVIAFPKTQKGQDLMAGSPTTVTAAAAQGTPHRDVAVEPPLA